MDTSEELGRRIYYYGEYEPAQEEALTHLLLHRRSLFDIGANLGVFTLQAASRGIEVTAFEPSVAARSFLEENLRINGLENAVRVLDIAVSDQSGALEFWETRDGNLGVGRIFPYGHARSNPSSYTVQTEPLDVLVDRFGKPDVVKVDIEGAEWLMLKGAQRTLKMRDAPDFLVEFHPDEIAALGGSLDQCLKHFAESGFRRYSLNRHQPTTGQQWSVFCKKPQPTARFLEEL